MLWNRVLMKGVAIMGRVINRATAVWPHIVKAKIDQHC